MKKELRQYTIVVNQIGVFRAGLADKTDLVDWAIFADVQFWKIHAPKTEKIIHDDAEYVLVDFKDLMHRNPLMGIKDKAAISRRIKKMIDLGLFDFVIVKKQYYLKISEKARMIVYYQENEFSQKIVDENQQSYKKRTKIVDENQQSQNFENGSLTKINDNEPENNGSLTKINNIVDENQQTLYNKVLSNTSSNNLKNQSNNLSSPVGDAETENISNPISTEKPQLPQKMNGAELVKYFCGMYAYYFRDEYIPSWQRDGAIMKKLFTTEKTNLPDLIDFYLNMGENKHLFWSTVPRTVKSLQYFINDVKQAFAQEN